MARPRLVRKLTRRGSAMAGDAAARVADKARQQARDVVNGGRWLCSCGGKECPGRFPTLRQQKAHAARMAAGRWNSKAARAAGRAMGKTQDRARRAARAMREAAGLIDARGNRTARGRARPEVARPGKVTRIRDLRHADRHDRDAERTDRRAGKHEQRAARADSRASRAQDRAEAAAKAGRDTAAVRHEVRVGTHERRAAEHRDRLAAARTAHHQRWPERTPARSRT